MAALCVRCPHRQLVKTRVHGGGARVRHTLVASSSVANCHVVPADPCQLDTETMPEASGPQDTQLIH